MPTILRKWWVSAEILGTQVVQHARPRSRDRPAPGPHAAQRRQATRREGPGTAATVRPGEAAPRRGPGAGRSQAAAWSEQSGAAIVPVEKAVAGAIVGHL